MVGICGVIGGETRSVENITKHIRLADDQVASTWTTDDVGVGYVDRRTEFETQPAVAETDGSSLWCWGTVLGHEYKAEYTRQDDETGDSEYCALLYDEYGLNFVAGLNSEFAGVVYDPESGNVSLFTDRLGSRPIYYTHTDEGSLVFSSLLQSLRAHPEVSLTADPPFLSEFLAYSRTFGTHTPVWDVHAVPPASVVTIDTCGTIIDSYRYWWPNPAPEELPFREFVTRFTETFTEAVRDRTGDERENGLLLSGGADSRLILEALDSEVTTFHMNERLAGNKEARTAMRVADVAGAEFRFLERSPDYLPRVLETTGGMTNFNGLFNQAHTAGFAREIGDRTDAVFSGHYADTLFGLVYVPMRVPDSILARNLLMPSRSLTVDTVREYVDTISSGRMPGYNGDPPYTDGLPAPKEVLDARIRKRDGRIVSHRVAYPSWRSLVEFGMSYPLSNTRSFLEYETLNQITLAQYPFLDNRVVDLALRLPSTYRYRRDVVSAALGRLNPELASIPHPENVVPLGHPFAVKHYAEKATSIAGNLRAALAPDGPSDSSPEPEVIGGGGSWTDATALIRAHSYVGDKLERYEDRIRSDPHLDFDTAWACYQRHLDGDDFTNELLALLTLLESSVIPDDSPNEAGEETNHR